MSVCFLQFIFLSFFFSVLGVEDTINNCKPTQCSECGPIIQFPFRDKNLSPEYCGYNPGFDVFCNEKNETVLLLPFSKQIVIERIDYVSQTADVYDPDLCLDRSQLPFQNPSLLPSPLPPHHYILFNCSADIKRLFRTDFGYCSYDFKNQHFVYVNSDRDLDLSLLPLASCTKITEFFVWWDLLKFQNSTGYADYPGYSYLDWTEPECGRCEADQERRCSSSRRLNDSTTTRHDQVFPCVYDPDPSEGPVPQPVAGADTYTGSNTYTGENTRASLVVAVAALGSCLFVAILGSIVLLCISILTESMEKNNQIKIEKFLEDQRALKPTRFSYSDLRRITLKFSEKLGEGGYGIVYKGKLLSSEINVAVKVLHNSKGNGDEFVNEVSTIGRIHHVNVVRLVGYCADGFRRALVYEFLPNDSLEKFIFQPPGSKKMSLGWQKLRDIALGIAKGIEYLHEGCDRQILHFDIKPHNILLDQNFNPKICDFGLAKLCAKEQSGVTMTAARGTMGYIAPEVLSRTFGRVSHKSDVYSFGMLLLEMVGGRKNIDQNVNTSQVYFPQWIYNHLDLNFGDDFWARIEEGEDGNIARRITIAGLWCIQWCPNDRPSMKDVLQMLEGPEESLTIPPNPFPANINVANPVVGMGMILGRHFEMELPLIQESEDFST